jgi:hypothetical protein
MATVRIDYFGMEGEGPTVTEAKKDAGRRIEAALRDTYTPEIVQLGQWAALVSRDARTGWGYALITNDDGSLRTGAVYGSVAFGRTKAEALKDAKRHIAQLCILDMDDETVLAFVDKDDHNQIRGYIEWQRKCRQALDAGMDVEAAREYASGMRSLVEV